MVRLVQWTIILATALGTAPLLAGYGDQVNGFPNQQERELHLVTNMARTAPQEFRDLYIGSYSILLPANYPAVSPIYLNTELNNAGRAHAEDMAANCGLQHNSCNGTLWSTRIKSYYTASGWIAENIASGGSSGFLTVVQLLRDDDKYNNPAPDNSDYDGHRKNIMSSRYQDFGPGYAYSPTTQWYDFWVQDFGGAPHAHYAIASASHIYLSSGQITFMASYNDPDGDAPQSTQVIINGVPHTMSHHLGALSNGSYQLSLPDDNPCRDYYFLFVDGDNRTWRYPETSELSNDPSQACYSPLKLTDAILALQVVASSLQSEDDAEDMVDYNNDGKIGLAEAIYVLKELAVE